MVWVRLDWARLVSRILVPDFSFQAAGRIQLCSACLSSSMGQRLPRACGELNLPHSGTQDEEAGSLGGMCFSGSAPDWRRTRPTEQTHFEPLVVSWLLTSHCPKRVPEPNPKLRGQRSHTAHQEDLIRLWISDAPSAELELGAKNLLLHNRQCRHVLKLSYLYPLKKDWSAWDRSPLPLISEFPYLAQDLHVLEVLRKIF